MSVPASDTLCACPRCVCADAACWITSADIALCGCCLTDCPDHHGESE